MAKLNIISKTFFSNAKGHQHVAGDELEDDEEMEEEEEEEEEETAVPVPVQA